MQESETSFLSGPNAAFITELYARYAEDPQSVDPDWRLACCLECGAVYEGAVLLLPSDRPAIVAALVQRPQAATRAWIAPQSAADLLAENVAQGIG